MVLSFSHTITLTAVLTIGCLVYLLGPMSLPWIFHGSPRRQLKVSSFYSDPRTVQPRSSVATSDDPGAAGMPVWWDDIDYQLHSCGKSMCYFPRASDPAKGYLVWGCWHSAIFRKAVRTYNYATWLGSKYNVRQLLSSPPYQSDTPESFAERLTAQETKKYRGAGSLVIQESINAPKGSKLFKCKGRHESMYDDLNYMIAHGNKGYELVLLEELSYTSQLLESEPRLAYNLQFLMDLDGRIYHLHLDRALAPRGGKIFFGIEGVVANARSCLENAANYIRSHSNPRTVQLRSSDATPDDPVAAGMPVWWDDIDYQLHSCGKSKCYFPKVSDPAKGYLVWGCSHSAIFKKAIRTYNYATWLESKYNVRQLLSSPPYQSDTPESFAEHLTAQETKKYRGVGSLVIQESINAPEGSKLFKCKGRHESMYDDLNYMIAHGNKGYELVLLEELSYTSQLLEFEPRLAYDFQFLMDLDGQIYHLDLDRALESRGGNKIVGVEGVVAYVRVCLKNAANYIISSMNKS